MIITVGFDCYAKLLECDNLNILEFPALLKKFNEWLYEEVENCICIKKSLNIKFLDISVVLMFLNQEYPKFNARVVTEYVAIEDIDEMIPIIAL